MKSSGEPLHVLVDLLALSLVLESGLGQINGKHASDPNDASNATINQFGRDARGEGEKCKMNRNK